MSNGQPVVASYPSRQDLRYFLPPPSIRFLFSERRTRTASTGGLKRLSTICPIDASQCCHGSYKPWLLKCVNLPPIAVNSTRVYISLRCCLSGPAVRFRRRAGGFQRPAKWLKWCTSLLFFFFLLFVQPFYLVPSFWFVYSSHNRLVRQPPLWSNLDLAADSWWTNSSIHFVAYRRPKVSDSFFSFFFFHSFIAFVPPLPFFRSESRLFLLRDSSPLFLCSPFSLFFFFFFSRCQENK